MLKQGHKILIYIAILILLSMSVLIIMDWSVDGFKLLKEQQYEFYFQSWVSIAGLTFTSVMTITIFIIYKKTELLSLKFMSLSFLTSSFAYLIIGYHSSYCKVCSDLAMCSASHNYSNYFIIIALITFVATVLLENLKNNIVVLKLFSYGLIIASSMLLSTLFISIQFMEIPGLLFYEIKTINLQGFIYFFPMILIAFLFIYLKKEGKLTNTMLLIFSLLFLSFIPQAYHILLCDECNTMECSEFYIFAGLIMFISLGLFVYSLSLQLNEKVDK